MASMPRPLIRLLLVAMLSLAGPRLVCEVDLAVGRMLHVGASIWAAGRVMIQYVEAVQPKEPRR
jgi:hypothetical protein